MAFGAGLLLADPPQCLYFFSDSFLFPNPEIISTYFRTRKKKKNGLENIFQVSLHCSRGMYLKRTHSKSSNLLLCSLFWLKGFLLGAKASTVRTPMGKGQGIKETPEGKHTSVKASQYHPAAWALLAFLGGELPALETLLLNGPALGLGSCTSYLQALLRRILIYCPYVSLPQGVSSNLLSQQGGETPGGSVAAQSGPPTARTLLLPPSSAHEGCVQGHHEHAAPTDHSAGGSEGTGRGGGRREIGSRTRRRRRRGGRQGGEKGGGREGEEEVGEEGKGKRRKPQRPERARLL